MMKLTLTEKNEIKNYTYCKNVSFFIFTLLLALCHTTKNTDLYIVTYFKQKGWQSANVLVRTGFGFECKMTYLLLTILRCDSWFSRLDVQWKWWLIIKWNSNKKKKTEKKRFCNCLLLKRIASTWTKEKQSYITLLRENVIVSTNILFKFVQYNMLIHYNVMF